LPFDALPVYDEVKYIHTARGGLDACFSFHNHFLNFTPGYVGNIQRIAQEDGDMGSARCAASFISANDSSRTS